jgi:hypothetical protein
MTFRALAQHVAPTQREAGAQPAQRRQAVERLLRRLRCSLFVEVQRPATLGKSCRVNSSLVLLVEWSYFKCALFLGGSCVSNSGSTVGAPRKLVAQVTQTQDVLTAQGIDAAAKWL